ncbi:hypothetical protein P692DRAFT_201808500 [Suillus brevipes Sb2]|nr:hypothetical protein P692DRAFT_201808500 [Suillus brevipes Sb2]
MAIPDKYGIDRSMDNQWTSASIPRRPETSRITSDFAEFYHCPSNGPPVNSPFSESMSKCAGFITPTSDDPSTVFDERHWARIMIVRPGTNEAAQLEGTNSRAGYRDSLSHTVISPDYNELALVFCVPVLQLQLLGAWSFHALQWKDTTVSYVISKTARNQKGTPGGLPRRFADGTSSKTWPRFC